MASKTKRIPARWREVAEIAAAQTLGAAEAIARGEGEPPPLRVLPRKGRPPLQKLVDQYVAVQLTLRGYTQEQIASAMGLKHQLVSSDLSAATTIFRERAAESVEELRGKHLLMADAAISDLWRSWRASKGETTTTTTEARRGGTAGTAGGRVVSKKVQGHGDVGYIFGMHKIMERSAKLAGLDKPVEAKIYVEQAQETIDRVANALVEELHSENPVLLQKILDRIAMEDGTAEREREMVEADAE